MASFRDHCLSQAYLDILSFGKNTTLTTLTAINVSHAVAPGTTSPASNWTLVPFADWPKTFDSRLSIECPVPLCVFPISSTFGSLRRVLFYGTMAIAVFVPRSRHPILRRLAVTGLFVFAVLSSFYFAALAFFLHDLGENIVELDRLPAFFAQIAGGFVVAHTVDSETGLFGPLVPDEVPDPQPRPVQFVVMMYSVTAYLMMLFFSFLFNIAAAGNNNIPARMVVSGDGAYRLTSACYIDNDGLHFWDAISSFGFRDMKDVVFHRVPLDRIDPRNFPAFLDASLGAVSPVHLSTVSTGSWVTLIVIVTSLLVLRAVSTARSCLSIHDLPIGKILCRAPQWLIRRLPRSTASYFSEDYRMPFNLVQNIWLFYFMFTPAFSLLLLAVALELGIRHHQTPVVESAKAFGQWGPIVGVGVVLLIVVSRACFSPPTVNDRTLSNDQGEEVRLLDYLERGDEGEAEAEQDSDEDFADGEEDRLI